MKIVERFEKEWRFSTCLNIFVILLTGCIFLKRYE